MSHYTEKTPPLSLPCSQELMEKTQAFCSLCARAASAHDVAYLFLGSCVLARSIAAKVFYVLFHNICFAALIGFCSCFLSELTEAGTRVLLARFTTSLEGSFPSKRLPSPCRCQLKQLQEAVVSCLRKAQSKPAMSLRMLQPMSMTPQHPLNLAKRQKSSPRRPNALLLRQMLSLPLLQLQPLLKQNRLKKPSSKPKQGLHESEEQGMVGNLRTSTTG